MHRYISIFFIILTLVLASCSNRVAPSSGSARVRAKQDVSHGKFGMNWGKGSKPPQMGFYPKQNMPNQPIKNFFFKTRLLFVSDAKKRMLVNNRRLNSKKTDEKRRRMYNKSMQQRFVKKRGGKIKRGGSKVKSFDRTPDAFKKDYKKRGGIFRKK